MIAAGAVDFARWRGARRAHSRSYVTDEQRSQRAKDQARREHYAPDEALGALPGPIPGHTGEHVVPAIISGVTETLRAESAPQSLEVGIEIQAGRVLHVAVEERGHGVLPETHLERIRI